MSVKLWFLENQGENEDLHFRNVGNVGNVGNVQDLLHYDPSSNPTVPKPMECCRFRQGPGPDPIQKFQRKILLYTGI